MARDPFRRTGDSPLDDPHLAARAWAHYRRMLRFAAELAAAMVGITWVVLFHEFGLVSIHLYIASALGIGLTVLLTGALMSLVFLSHRSGHDAAIEDRLDNDVWD